MTVMRKDGGLFSGCKPSSNGASNRQGSIFDCSVSLSAVSFDLPFQNTSYGPRDMIPNHAEVKRTTTTATTTTTNATTTTDNNYNNDKKN